ncbi:6-phosphogluconolactonase [Litoreibacter roseus]|uniref:6-phosphogluconolactonase n=1 Tax=Litoreibacter roseus TaxID=2601869 RepID=A0A6N6JD56_9RHOB|nr:6-phosphogluconolactonase [Litoreibacter roseus]GFE64271.1 6-phosphogluconolactonase [Litoreibacter roseus]
MKLEEYPDRDMMMIDLANQLAGELEECLLVHEFASFAVPGGTTPGPVFDALSAAPLDWTRVHVMPTDERMVPAGHDRSNEKLIRERLLTGRAADAGFLGFAGRSEDLDGLATDLAPNLPISVLLLGMGSDMHTASLFPGADELTAALDKGAPPVMKITAPGAPEPRLTLTRPVLEGAMSTHVLISGNEKREALHRAAAATLEEAPIKAVLANATVHWAP